MRFWAPGALSVAIFCKEQAKGFSLQSLAQYFPEFSGLLTIWSRLRWGQSVPIAIGMSELLCLSRRANKERATMARPAGWRERPKIKQSGYNMVDRLILNLHFRLALAKSTQLFEKHREFRFDLLIFPLQDRDGQLELIAVPDAVAQVCEHGFYSF